MWIKKGLWDAYQFILITSLAIDDVMIGSQATGGRIPTELPPCDGAFGAKTYGLNTVPADLFSPARDQQHC